MPDAAAPRLRTDPVHVLLVLLESIPITALTGVTLPTGVALSILRFAIEEILAIIYLKEKEFAAGSMAKELYYRKESHSHQAVALFNDMEYSVRSYAQSKILQ